MKRDPLIIFLGLPKCATVSFTAAFNAHGLKAAHWGDDKGPFGPRVVEALTKGMRILDPLIADGYRVFTQIDYCMDGWCFFPQNSLLELMVRQYPDALYILNRRSVVDHVRSIKAWGDFADRLEAAGVGDLAKFIILHEARVLDLFGSVSARKFLRFLHYDIDRSDRRQLTEFVNIPDLMIPHLNKTHDNTPAAPHAQG